MPPRVSSCAAVCLAVLVSARAASFDPEAGLPLIRNFPPEAYRGHSQIFASARAPDGVMYFGTYGAVVAFDGERWRQHPVSGTWTRALAVGRDGLVYVGGGNTLGRLEPAAGSGEPVFVSLADRLPAAQRDFGTVWSAAAADDDLLFSVDGAVFAWRDGTFKVWPFPRLRPAIRATGDAVFCHAGDQLLRWTEGDWRPLARDARLGSIRRLTLLPASAGEWIAAGDNGLLLRVRVDGTLTEWKTPAADFLARSGIRNGLRLRDGDYLLSTAGEGLLQLSPDGRPVRRLTVASGLAHSATYGLGEGVDGTVWVETANGLSVFDPLAAWSMFDGRNGRPDTIGGEPVRFHGRVLLTFSDVALCQITPAADAFASARITPYGSLPAGRVANSITMHGALLFGSERGVLRLTTTPAGETATLLHATSSPIEDARTLRALPDLLVVGLLRGAEIVRVLPDFTASLVARVPDFDAEVTNIAEAPGREAWMGSTAGYATRVRFHPDGTLASTTRFGPERGMPSGTGWVKVHGTPDAVLVCVRDGVFRVDARGERLARDPRFARHFPAGINTLPIDSDGAGRFWFQVARPGGFEAGCLDTRGDGPPRWTPLPGEVNESLGFGGLRDVLWLREADREFLWVSGTRSTVRLELGRTTGPASAPAALVTELAQGPQRWRPGREPLRIPFSREPLRLLFSGPRAALHPLGYETRLLGYSDAWSTATSPESTYTNLVGGPFVLEVRARDSLGRTGEVARVTFFVAPPWHRTPLAYTCYGLGAAGAVFGFVRWRLGHAERERRRLAGLVATRTAELATARDQAEAASRAKSAFLAAMSHELRTPLNGVIGYAQILQTDPRLAPDQQERLRIVQHSGEHLLRMINDVLDLAKIEAGKVELRPEPFVLAELLHDVAASHAPAAARKNLAFTLDAAPGLPVAVHGDVQKLRQVLDNLVGNAIKFTHAGGVTLQVTRAADDTVAFAVRDTGPGIAAADQPRLFQPFEQATSRGDAPGTGLGLAISRELVHRLGGAIQLASDLGRGSTFSFAVALPPASPPAVASSSEARIAGHDGPVQRVFIVDDHAVNRRVVADLLAPLGFACEEFAAGAAALERLAGPAVPWPDLLILDVRMAGLDGLAVTRQVRALPRGREVKILLMSASVLTFDPRAGQAAGADDFVPKPFRTAELLEKISRLLGLRWRENSPVPAPPMPVDANPSAAAPLPAEAVHRLRETLAQGDLEAFRRALGTARTAHPAAEARWRALDEAAAAYQLSRLRQLLEST